MGNEFYDGLAGLDQEIMNLQTDPDTDAANQTMQTPARTAGGSLFGRIAGVLMMGIAAGSDTDDFATGVAKGIANVELKKEQERQIAMQEKEMKMKEHLYKVQIASGKASLIKARFDLGNAPEEFRQASEARQAQLIQAYHAVGLVPEYEAEESMEGVNGIINGHKEAGTSGEFLSNVFTFNGRKITGWKPDPTKIAPPGSVVEESDLATGKVVRTVDYSGKPLDHYREAVEREDKKDAERYRQQMDMQRTKLSEAGAYDRQNRGFRHSEKMEELRGEGRSEYDKFTAVGKSMLDQSVSNTKQLTKAVEAKQKAMQGFEWEQTKNNQIPDPQKPGQKITKEAYEQRELAALDAELAKEQKAIEFVQRLESGWLPDIGEDKKDGLIVGHGKDYGLGRFDVVIKDRQNGVYRVKNMMTSATNAFTGPTEQFKNIKPISKPAPKDRQFKTQAPPPEQVQPIDQERIDAQESTPRMRVMKNVEKTITQAGGQIPENFAGLSGAIERYQQAKSYGDGYYKQPPLEEFLAENFFGISGRPNRNTLNAIKNILMLME